MWKTKTKKEDPHNLFPVADVSFQANNCRVLVFHGGVVASCLECTTTDRVVRVRVLAGYIMLYSWARHFTLIVPLSTQVYNWVPAKILGVALR